ncbi:major facilitator superfamily domain-containing protein [Echria macrotheca]|uniref:Major facilitator superfamily domain-containing protein n=1 Tax=Echria macrotheca TaxID=438768 RepID=A0AAJ0BC88_9PEZI|nr:major facilitator superfamily domain-containing protein [Echria macrotheca]
MAMASDSEPQTGPEHVRPRWKWWNRDIHEDVKHLTTINYSVKERERQILKLVDDNGFNSKVFFVAASGFLASSYSLFSTNVITPAISFVSPACGRLGIGPGEVIDLLTLLGTISGMLVMGHFADRAGRKRLYGLELAILIVATMGVVQASEGFTYQSPDGSIQRSMDMYAWLAWWRTALGYGIGAEYPISAIIVAEWASTESRGTMLAAVKSMQSLARILAVAIGLGALRNTAKKRGLQPDAIQTDPIQLNNARLVVDEVWRTVIGIAIVPAAIAIFARLTIPETPRYYVDIMKDLRKAVRKALQVYKTKRVEETNTPEAVTFRQNSDQNEHWYRGAWNYLKRDRHAVLKKLALVSLLWAIMDVGFYGNALDSPSALATLFRGPQTVSKREVSLAALWRRQSDDNGGSCVDDTSWRAESEPATTTIYHMLEYNSIRSILIVGIPSMVGSLTAIVIVNYFRRKMILLTTFLVLAVLFAITGGTLISSYRDGQGHTTTLAFYAIIQFVYNLGPNTIIFILASEIFPTVYRGTFYGIAAAGGKVGAVVIRAIIGGTGNQEMALGIRVLVLMPLMLIAAFLSWFLPDVQYPPNGGPSRQREETEGIAVPNGEVPRTQQDEGGDEIASDTTSTHSVEERVRRRRMKSNKSWWWPVRLQNMTLEDIAPNPSLHEKRRKATSNPQSPTNGVEVVSSGALKAQ